MQEQISLLMDGEDFDVNVVAELIKNKAMQQRWHQYQLIRDAMRGSLHPATINMDIAERIEKEIQTIKIEVPSKGILMKAKHVWQNMTSKDARSSNWFMPMGQLGVAACVALVVVFGVQNFNNTEFEEIKPALNPSPIGVNVQPVGYDSFNQANEAKQKENDKLHLLLQDYERQRRMYLE